MTFDEGVHRGLEQVTIKYSAPRWGFGIHLSETQACAGIPASAWAIEVRAVGAENRIHCNVNALAFPLLLRCFAEIICNPCRGWNNVWRDSRGVARVRAQPRATVAATPSGVEKSDQAHFDETRFGFADG